MVLAIARRLASVARAGGGLSLATLAALPPDERRVALAGLEAPAALEASRVWLDAEIRDLEARYEITSTTMLVLLGARGER